MLILLKTLLFSILLQSCQNGVTEKNCPNELLGHWIPKSIEWDVLQVDEQTNDSIQEKYITIFSFYKDNKVRFTNTTLSLGGNDSLTIQVDMKYKYGQWYADSLGNVNINSKKLPNNSIEIFCNSTLCYVKIDSIEYAKTEMFDSFSLQELGVIK